jgi:tetratricopeptide (TPR) repeat protein
LNRRSRWLLALLLPLPLAAATVALAEGLLALTGTQPPRFFEKVTGESGALIYRRAARAPIPQTQFRLQEFSPAPPPGTERILVLGGSTAFGHPFEPPAPFANWLDARLKHLLPEHAFEVLNLGSNGFHSDTLLRLLQDLDDLEASALVIYSGHNEFLDRNLEAVLRPYWHSVRSRVQRSRLGTWLGTRIDSRTAPANLPGHLLEKQLIHDAPLLSEAQLQRGHQNFAHDLRLICHWAAQRKIRVLLCQPVSDLLDTPVEYAFFCRETKAPQRQQLRAALEQVRGRRRHLEEQQQAGAAADLAAVESCLADLEQCSTLDPQVAQLHYERGRLLLLLGRTAQAEAELRRARERDGHPIRATPAIHQTLTELGRDLSLPVADPRSRFRNAAPNGLPGQNGLFMDYCHPDLEGHRLIADAVLEAMAQAEWFAARESWQFSREPEVEQYEVAMGLSRTAQARGFANNALMALGQSYFRQDNEEALEAAGKWFAVALRTDPECALAHAGLGVLAALRGEQAKALASFAAADARDPQSYPLILQAYESQPHVRELFARAGIEFVNGQARAIPVVKESP